MPGRGSYGPGGRWIHDRAHHIMSKNEDMDKSTAYAIATQQAHKVGKSPKGFRTAEGVRTARAKMSGPVKMYKKTAGVPRVRWRGKNYASKLKGIHLRKPTGSEGASVVDSVMHRDKSKTAEVRLSAFFDELEKLGAVSDLLARGAVRVGEQAVKHPGAAYWRTRQQKKGLSKHEQTMLALKHGYPAGWVSLGIRPR